MGVKPLQSLQRALSVIEAIAEHQPIGVAALARVLGEDKSAVQRVLVTLQASGWIRSVGDDLTRWEISSAPLVVAAQAQRRSGMLARARPVLEALRDLTGETTIWAVPDGRRVVTVDVVESRQLVRTAPHLGMVMPVDTSAAALAIYAHLDEDEIARFGAPLDDPAFAGHLAAARTRGWSLNDGATSAGATSIGAAVLDSSGRPTAAIVVSAPSDRLGPPQFDHVGRQVLDAAAALGPGHSDRSVPSPGWNASSSRSPAPIGVASSIA
jgi:IclR family acetate operon transcriptional repressor